MDPSHPPVRVLTRPPSPSLSLASDPSTLSKPPPPPQPSSPGVVVVGFISRRPHDSSQLINRILDANVFGSGSMDKPFWVDNEEVVEWLKCRRISYYHEVEKGILFLQFCGAQCPGMDAEAVSQVGFDSVVEEREFGDLQGMLFMFSVCHVIVYIQEGSHFDTRILKEFRVLQASKHALAPFIRSQAMPPFPSRPHSSSFLMPTSSSSPSPGRGGGNLSRNASISVMSALGSYTSFFPGQCTPVMLFVFVDDFSGLPNSSSDVEDSLDTSAVNGTSSLNTVSRPSLPTKGSGPVVVLARPSSKSGGFRKKLQLSLEGQIRFLIKKCRILSGSESSHSGSRSGASSSSVPLFSLDASRSVLLLDRSANQRGESLEFATGLVEDVLNRKATSDSLLLENPGQNANKEDILSVKEFIYRQSDILRGRGGLGTNPNNGAPAGVGMAAAAAAAAAASASAASVKAVSAPELPNFDTWLSSGRVILHALLSAKPGCMDDVEMSRRKPSSRNATPPKVDGNASRVVNPLDTAVSWLKSGKGLNTKFSMLWCQKSLPAAREIYLKYLPDCYPTSLHKAHLENALSAFRSMVKGPAVNHFAHKLEEECTSIWKSGRQLCDAVSLTGKQCMHQRHDVETCSSFSTADVKPHCSGYVFLHACACGRSRSLRLDPFDFEMANITSSCFPECDKLLPALQLPNIGNSGPIQPSSWSLIRIGGARYYEPLKGLLQSGFCATQKFLMKWTISLEKPVDLNGSIATMQQGSVTLSSTDAKLDFTANVSVIKSGSHVPYRQSDNVVGNQGRSLGNIQSDDKKISFGKGLPKFTMKKPFSEVVAGSATANSEFPPLQQSRKTASSLEKGNTNSHEKEVDLEQIDSVIGHQVPRKPEDNSSFQKSSNAVTADSSIRGDSVVHIGSNAVPVVTSEGEKIRGKPLLEHAIVYIGFEHECPHGHRYLLKPEHLNELGAPYSLLEERQVRTSVESLDQNPDNLTKGGKNGGRGKAHKKSNSISSNNVNKRRNSKKTEAMVANANVQDNGMIHFSKAGNGQVQVTDSILTEPSDEKDMKEGLHPLNTEDAGDALSMLNRDLPIYMNCPHCRVSKNKDPPKTKFASNISQLQRIFLVTPAFPVVLATCPVVQFEGSCLPPSVPDREQKLQFSLGCRVILPPESFLTIRLPFLYGVQLEDRSLKPLNPFEHQPELTAWLIKGTTLHLMSKGGSPDKRFQI